MVYARSTRHRAAVTSRDGPDPAMGLANGRYRWTVRFRTELGDLAQSAGATLRVLDTVVETLAGDCDQLGLTPREGESPWLKAALWEKTDAKSFNL